MNAQLSTRLRHLRLSGMVEALPARVAQAEAAPLAHLEFLELLVDDELSRRADRLFARRLKQAGIVTLKTLADFDWTFNAKLPKAKLVSEPGAGLKPAVSFSYSWTGTASSSMSHSWRPRAA